MNGSLSSCCERDGNIGDAATAKPAFTVVTYNAYPADRKIDRNGTKVKSQDQVPRGLSTAIVRYRDFLQSLVAVGEVDAGQGAPIEYIEPDFSAGPIAKRCWDAIFYPVILFENQRCA